MGGELSYPETAERFEIRPVTESDGDAVNTVLTNSPDTGELSVAPQLSVNPLTMEKVMAPNSQPQMFLAEAPDGTPAGTGMVRRDTVRIHGEHRPYGKLTALAVRPEYRGEGLAKRLAVERIRHAERQVGDSMAITAGIQSGNEPSRAVAENWAESFPYETAMVTQQPLESAPEQDRYTVRPASDDEYGTIAHQRDAFYADADLFSIRDGDQLRAAVEQPTEVIGQPISEYLVAMHDGDIVAGGLLVDRHEMMRLEIAGVPGDEDELPPGIPASREIRPTNVVTPWYEQGHVAAGKVLLDYIRAREKTGNRVSLRADPSGPVSPLFDSEDVATEIRWAVRGVANSDADSFAAP